MHACACNLNLIFIMLDCMQRIFDLEFKFYIHAHRMHTLITIQLFSLITFKYTLTQPMSVVSADEAMPSDEVQATASSHTKPSKQKVCLHVHMYNIKL